MMECRNSLVRSDESVLTAVVGLDDVIVCRLPTLCWSRRAPRPSRSKLLVEQLKLHNYRAAVTSIAVMIGSDPLNPEISPTIRAIIGDPSTQERW
jgi:hypothetical protein